MTMTTFVLVFLSLYSALHAFVIFRAKAAFAGRALWLTLACLFSALMVLSPVIVRLLERAGHETEARTLAFVAYPWMGFVFICFSLFLVTGVLDLLLKLVAVLVHLRVPSLSARAPTLLFIGVAAAACVYGAFEARAIRVERVEIRTTRLPPELPSVRVAQISDVHLGLLVRDERWRLILERVRAEHPDIFVSTGDLVDGDVPAPEAMSRLADQIVAPLGKFAITGNHEAYAGLGRSADITHRLGFQLLRGRAVTVAGAINIVGVDDPAVTPEDGESMLLATVQNGLFTLFLKHRPVVPESSLGLFDLQLSGHTHKGQIFPFTWLSRFVFPYQSGLFDLGAGSMLYTSRGSGTWGPPIRVLAPPEVTIIDIVRAEKP